MAGELKAVIGPVDMRSGSVGAAVPATSPGQQDVHYAPRTPTYRFERGQMAMIKGSGNGVIFLSWPRTAKGWEMVVGLSNDPTECARDLYTTLRWFDSEGLRAIYVEMPPDRPEWAAVRDRLMRATRPIQSA
jgi:L-threonylcarbamoyladenylate synthase